MPLNPRLMELQIKRTVLVSKMEVHMHLMKYYLDLVHKEKNLLDEHIAEATRISAEIQPLQEEFLKPDKP